MNEENPLPDSEVTVEPCTPEDDDDQWIDLSEPTHLVELYLQIQNTSRWQG